MNENAYIGLLILFALFGALIGFLALLKTTIEVLIHMFKHNPRYMFKAIGVSGLTAVINILTGNGVIIEIELVISGFLGFFICTLYFLFFG